MLLGNAYEFGSPEIPAPQATLMKTIIEGVLAGALPWDLVLTGAGLSIGAMLCGVSGLAFAIGVYLPLATMAPLFVGGCVRALVERNRAAARRRRRAIPASSPPRAWSPAKASPALPWRDWSRPASRRSRWTPRLGGLAGEVDRAAGRARGLRVPAARRTRRDGRVRAAIDQGYIRQRQGLPRATNRAAPCCRRAGADPACCAGRGCRSPCARTRPCAGS